MVKEAQKLAEETDKKEYENFCSSAIFTTFPNSERVLKTQKSTEQIQFPVFCRQERDDSSTRSKVTTPQLGVKT
jgi:hypothetical protein